MSNSSELNVDKKVQELRRFLVLHLINIHNTKYYDHDNNYAIEYHPNSLRSFKVFLERNCWNPDGPYSRDEVQDCIAILSGKLSEKSKFFTEYIEAYNSNRNPDMTRIPE